MGKKAEKKVELLVPPVTHMTASEFLKKVRVKAKPDWELMLSELSLAARTDRDSVNFYDDSDDSDDSASDDSSDSDQDDATRTARMLGKSPAFVILAGGMELRHHTAVMRKMCDLMASDAGSVGAGLEVASTTMARLSGFCALRLITVRAFVASKIASAEITPTTERQWTSVLKALLGGFHRQGFKILALIPEGSEDHKYVEAFPIWLLEVLFSVQDKNRVSRRVVVP